MWGDTFKLKSGNLQNIGVTGVASVTLPRKPNTYAGFSENSACHTENNRSVAGVTKSGAITPATPCHTTTNARCDTAGIARKLSIHAGSAIFVTPATPVTPQKHDIQEIDSEQAELLASFRFDLVQVDIDTGYSVDELLRVNNLAWRLMMAKGLQFEEAMTTAALWVANNAPHDDEAKFVDVMKLFKRISA